MRSQQLQKDVSETYEPNPQFSDCNANKQSELTRDLYNPIIDTIQLPNFNVLAEKLNQSGIHIQQSNFSTVFCKSCIKTDWESTVYDVKYGKLRTQLKVIYFKLDSNLLCNNLLDSGGFGQVMRFRTSAGEFALKNIKHRKNKPESVDSALKEVFMAKVLSALEVGPKFVKLFSYDAIVFQNCVQFAMQMCRTKFEKHEIQKELKKRGLLKLLKIMHSLRICHMDIKSGNIAWSPSLDRFIFLDFTFTKFIQEPIGFKTLTKFEGTFHHASPEMKKRCMLQDQSFVDLYYNDLYCLEGAWKQMEYDLQVTKNSLIKEMAESRLKINDKENENNSIVNYFRFKMGLFEQNLAVMTSLAQNEKLLLKTFKTMIAKCQLNEIQSSSQLFALENDNSGSQIDKILVTYELSIKDSPLLVTLLEIVEDGSQSLFEQAWQEDFYKQKMFFFIDVYSNPDLQDQNLRKNLVDKIYCQIDTAHSETSYMMRLRRVIEYYGNYFGKKRNIEVVEKIMSYFVLMQDRQTREKLEDMMLSTLEQQENYLEYSERNFKYFLGEIATMNPISTWHYERYIKNSHNLIQQLSKKMVATDSLMVEISETLRLMKMIKNYKIERLYKLGLEDQMQIRQITSLLNKKGQEIREFTYSALQFKKLQIAFSTISVAKKSEFKDHFFQKCALQIAITNCVLKERVFSLKLMMQSENFLSKFRVLAHLSMLEIHNEAERAERKEICANYLKIYIGPSQEYTDQYFRVFQQSHSRAESGKYLVDWLARLRLSQISNLERLQNFKIILQDSIYYILNMKFYCEQKKMDCSDYKKYGEIVEPLLQYIADICEIKKNQAILTNSPELKETIYFKQKIIPQIRMYDLFLKAMVLVLLNKNEQALAIALQIVDQAIQSEECLMLFGLISFISESVKDRQEIQIATITLKLSTYLLAGDSCENLLQSSLCLLIILKAYRTKGLVSEAFDCIRRLCCYAETNKINITYTNVLKTVATFTQTCSQQEIKQFIQSTISCKLSDLLPCPVMSFVLYLSEIALINKGVVQDLVQKKRVIVVLVTFARSLSQGLYAGYRQMLHQQSHFLKGKGIKTLSEVRRMASQRIERVFLEFFSVGRREKKRKNFQSGSMELTISLARMKAQKYYQIYTGKKKEIG